MNKIPIRKLCMDKALMSKAFPYNPLDFQTINPHNNQLLKTFAFDDHTKTEKILEKAHSSFKTVKEQSLDQQIVKFKNLNTVLEKNKEALASLICTEMGKPITEARAEIERTSIVINYYIEKSAEFLAPKQLNDYGTFRNYYVHEPIGPILHITPWNLPVAVPLKSIIPCLAARNPCILKPAPNVPQTSLLLSKCFEEAGFKDNEFQVSFSDTNNIDKIIGDKRLRYVIFTGSTNAGKIVGKISGNNVKRCLLELGGSDPMIVLKDIDVNWATDQVVLGRMKANGQTCTSTKRVIVHEDIYDEFKKQLVKKLNEVPMGDPTKPDTRLGPLARFDLFMKLNSQLVDVIPDYDYNVDSGNYFKPLVIDNPDVHSRAYKEELFGPTITLFKRKTVEEMIDLANDTVYGLSASCLTRDVELGEKILSKIECGMTYLNTPFTTHPSVPFGGYKDSGFGRANYDSIFNEVTNFKTYTINKNKI